MPVMARTGPVPSAMPVTVGGAGVGTPTPPVMAMVAVLAPSAVVGVKITSKLQFAPIAMVAPHGNRAEGAMVKSGLAIGGLLAGTFAAIARVGTIIPARLLILKVFLTAPAGFTTPKKVPPTGGVISRPTVWPMSSVSCVVVPVLPRGSVTVI